jgi:hypothetical protein
MKKITFILIGIVIGIAISAAFVGVRIMPFYYIVAKETGQKPFTTLVGDLLITNCGDDLYMIKSKSHPKMTVLIGHLSNQSIMSDIEILDDSRNRFCFSDRDSDGSWDDFEYQTSNASYLYGRMNGYPDIILSDGHDPLVRIGEEYFKQQLIDGKHFIEKSGEMVELEYVPHCYMKIKDSEPVN